MENFQFNIYSSLLMVGFVQSIFFICLVFSTAKKNNVANVCICALLLTFALDLLDEYLIFTELSKSIPQIHLVNYSLDFIYGPLFFTYASILTSDSSLNRKHIYHYLPFFLSIFWIMLVSVKISSTNLSAIVFSRVSSDVSSVSLSLMDILSVISMVAYLILVFKKIIKHQTTIKTYYSYQQDINLKWLKNLLIVLVILFLMYALVPTYTSILTINNSNFIYYLFLVVMINVLGVKGLKQPIIFQHTKLPPKPKTDDHIQKYQKSSLAPENIFSIMEAVDEIMTAKMLFLNDKLTLDDLANETQIPKHWLSQSINEVKKVNFYDYVNSYRVKEAKRLLADASFKEKNIIDIAYESGFTAKSTFNSVFKKMCEMTPSQFRKTSGKSNKKSLV